MLYIAYVSYTRLPQLHFGSETEGSEVRSYEVGHSDVW
jgi:hypothetical protein